VFELKAFAPDIWIADGPPVNVVGPLQLPTRMVVVKLHDGSLWIESPIFASREDMEKLTQLGPVRYLVSPAKLHTWRIAPWSAAFAGAKRAVPPEIFRDEVAEAWGADLDQVVFRGNAFAQEVEFFHAQSGTLIFNDFIQNYAPQPHRIVLDALLKLSGARGGGVPTDIKLTFTNKELARQSLRKLLSWDFDNLIVAHGDCVRGGAKALVERAFAFVT